MAADLFGWETLRAAEAAVAEAHARQVEARRRARVAPHGERRTREIELMKATAGALRAEVELAAIRLTTGDA